MKTSLSLIALLGAAAALSACSSSDDSASPTNDIGDAGSSSSTAGSSSAAGSAGKAGGSAGKAGGEAAEAGAPGDEAGAGGSAPIVSGGSGGTGVVVGEAGAGGEAGEPSNTVAWYQCQSTDQEFVRRAILGVLGRHAYGQAEVNLYTDMISQIDQMDGYDPTAKISAPQTTLRHGRQAVINALLANPDYASNWGDLYRDFIRVQRIDEQVQPKCDALRVRTTDQKQVAQWVRDQNPLAGSDGKAAPTWADVLYGSIELDDVSPIYTSHLFEMVTTTYAGANATPIALELSRRADYGAWFDGAYLNRDVTCLGCHNSEFSVTFTPDPATNRFYPVPGLFEKALFGDSTGPATVGGFGGADRLHAPLRRAQFWQALGTSSPTSNTTDCNAATAAQISTATAAGTLANCASGDTVMFCLSDSSTMCKSEAIRERNILPWGMATACGTFIGPTATPIDAAYVEAKLGNVTGYRTSMFDVSSALRAGFNKLEVEGLGADADGNIADSDKAFAYLVSMNIVEKVWKEITGTPLTIANYFPRNAAARDQLRTLTDTFVKSGYSNKKLLATIFASPYMNMAAPETGCGTNPYGAPRIFDPWRSAEPLVSEQGNSITDSIQAISARTQARAAYAALGWPLTAYDALSPDTRTSSSGASFGQTNLTIPAGFPSAGSTTALVENQFQTETGYYLKASQPGFRGLDFQGRLGWEDRFSQCQKLYPYTANTDVIDLLVAQAKKPGAATLGELAKVLKDRIMGDTAFSVAEKPLIQLIGGASFNSDASTIPDLNGTLRRICGAMIASPQFLLTGLQPKDGTEVPAQTPTTYSYQNMCTQLAALPLTGLSVTCTSGQPLTVNISP
jgi:hypothetical protein